MSTTRLPRNSSALAAAAPLRVERVSDPIELLVSYGAADYAGGEALAEAIESADRRMYQHKVGRRAERQAAVVGGPLPASRGSMPAA